MFWIASRCFWPNAPCPAINTFMTLPSATLEDDVPDRGRGGRDVIEAVDLLHPGAERPAHDEPHHELDRFGAGLPQVLERLNAHEPLRVPGQSVEERLVEGGIRKAGA